MVTARKPVIFISHVSDDEAIALYLKDFFEQIFLNVDVFVSGRDLIGGELWFEELRGKLSSATIVIALVSPYSLQSNWVHFEAGAGFTRKRTIPLLLDEISFGNLAPPLSLLQARLFNGQGMSKLLEDVSGLIGLRPPARYPGLPDLFNAVQHFIERRRQESIPGDATPRMQDVVTAAAVDPDIERRVQALKKRAALIMKAAIAERRRIFDLPDDEQLDRMTLTDLSKLAGEVGIDVPFLLASRIESSAMAVPYLSDPLWKKQSYLQNIQSLESLVEVFEMHQAG